MTDTLPANTTFVSLVAPAGWNCTTPAVGGGGTVNCNGNTVPAVFTLTVLVSPATAPGTVISNTANATGPGLTPAAATANTTVTAPPVADLGITKSGAGTANAGANIVYTITITNPAAQAATNVVMNDAIPANTTFVSLASPPGWVCNTPAVGGTGNLTCTNASLAGGGSAIFTLTVLVAPATAAGTVISNTATVASTPADPVTGNNSATANTSVTAAPVADLGITKSGATSVNVGSNITYTITVTNNSAVAATNVVMNDAIPANTTFVSLAAPPGWTCMTPAVGGTGNVNCTNPSLPGGASAVFTLVVNTNAGLSNGVDIANTATIASTPADPAPANNSATAHTTISAPDIIVTSVTGPAVVDNAKSTDQLLQYQFTVTNQGTMASGNVFGSGTVNHSFIAAMPPFTLLQSTSNPGNFSNAVPDDASLICHLVLVAANSFQPQQHVEVQCHDDNGMASGETHVVTVNVYASITTCGALSAKGFADPQNVVNEGTTGEANNGPVSRATDFNCGDIDVQIIDNVPGEDLSVAGGSYTSAIVYRVFNDGNGTAGSPAATSLITATGHVQGTGIAPVITVPILFATNSGVGAPPTTTCATMNVRLSASTGRVRSRCEGTTA